MYYVRANIYLYMCIVTAARRRFGEKEGRLFFNIVSAPLQIIISIGTLFCLLRTIFFKRERLFILYYSRTAPQ